MEVDNRGEYVNIYLNKDEFQKDVKVAICKDIEGRYCETSKVYVYIPVRGIPEISHIDLEFDVHPKHAFLLYEVLDNIRRLTISIGWRK